MALVDLLWPAVYGCWPAWRRLSSSAARHRRSAARTHGTGCVVLGSGPGGEYVAANFAAVQAAPHRLADARYRNIESIHVGERVVTDGGLANNSGGGVWDDPNHTDVDPATWRLVQLRVEATARDGSMDRMQVTELMPASLLDKEAAAIGQSIPVPLDLGDINEQGYRALVEAIEPCPAIDPPPGRVVLSTITHLNDYVFALTVADASGAEDRLGVTGFHKLYSQTRGWTSVGDLHVGERLRGELGNVRVVRLDRLPGAQRVYNLTVEHDHVYYVGGLRTLSHNADDCFKEVFTNPADAIGDPNGTAQKVGQAKTKNQKLIDRGYTETHYYRDSNGLKHTVFYNPTTKTFGGGHVSSGQ